MGPGSCVICSSASDQRRYIDFGVQVRRFGRIYFCELCFADCAKIVGWASPDEYKEIAQSLIKLSFTADELKEENAKLRSLIDTGISELRNYMVEPASKSEAIKKPVGRPKVTKPGTPK